MKSLRLTSSLHACSIVLAALMAIGTTACQTSESSKESASYQPGRVDLSTEATAKVSVASIDRDTRLITLRRADGSMFVVEATAAVRNFDQINAGDELRVHYQESLSATLRPAGESTTPLVGAMVVGRAKMGEKPAGGAGVAATAKVEIASVDRDNNIVVFMLDSGEFRTVRAVRPEGRQFVQTLKVGDIVQLDYSASLALSIEKL